MLLTMLVYTQKLLSWVGGWVVQLSCEIKGYLSPQLGIGWLAWAELGNKNINISMSLSILTCLFDFTIS